MWMKWRHTKRKVNKLFVCICFFLNLLILCFRSINPSVFGEHFYLAPAGKRSPKRCKLGRERCSCDQHLHPKRPKHNPFWRIHQNTLSSNNTICFKLITWDSLTTTFCAFFFALRFRSRKWLYLWFNLRDKYWRKYVLQKVVIGGVRFWEFSCFLLWKDMITSIPGSVYFITNAIITIHWSKKSGNLRTFLSTEIFG